MIFSPASLSYTATQTLLHQWVFMPVSSSSHTTLTPEVDPSIQYIFITTSPPTSTLTTNKTKQQKKETMASRIPHHLEPYLVLSDPATLIALTSVLGASTNWLITRYLHALLTTPSPQHASHSSPSSPSPYPRNDGPPPQQQQPPAVLLISFLRSLPFWKDSLSRLGTDLETAARRGRFAYVDGLGCELFSPSSSASSPSPRQHQQQQAWQQGWQGTLPSASPEDIKRIVLQGVELLRRGSSSTGAAGGEGRRVILVVDGLDFVLAASPGGSGTALAMKEVLMELREVRFFCLFLALPGFLLSLYVFFT